MVTYRRPAPSTALQLSGAQPVLGACDPYRESVETALAASRNAMAMWQDLQSCRVDQKRPRLYRWCMARRLSITVRLDREDAEVLARARWDGLVASDLARKGLRTVAASYYRGRPRPSTGLFVSTDAKLGDEGEVFRDLER
jgi:hypothetical protein